MKPKTHHSFFLSLGFPHSLFPLFLFTPIATFHPDELSKANKNEEKITPKHCCLHFTAGKGGMSECVSVRSSFFTALLFILFIFSAVVHCVQTNGASVHMQYSLQRCTRFFCCCAVFSFFPLFQDVYVKRALFISPRVTLF